MVLVRQLPSAFARSISRGDVFAGLFGVIALLYIIAISTRYWVDFNYIDTRSNGPSSVLELPTESELGLWEYKLCVSGECDMVDLPSGDSDLAAARAFAVLSVLFTVAAVILRLAGSRVRKWNRFIGLLGYVAFTFGWIFMLISTAVFADRVASVPENINATDFYGYSFALAVAGWMLSFFITLLGAVADLYA
jgi:hypothetical protein